MKRPLILLGGGGHCKSVIEAAESAGYNILGILDISEVIGNEILPNHRVLGDDNDIPIYIDKADFVVTVGYIKNPSIRIRLYNQVQEAGGHLATIIASTAHVSQYASIGEGTVILHQAVVNAGAQVGENVILNTFTNIEHNTIVGAQSHISTGTMINGDCKIGERVFIGSHSVLVNGITIGDDVIIGAGSSIRKSIMEKGIYYNSSTLLKL